jgi:hypothetical protein
MRRLALLALAGLACGCGSTKTVVEKSVLTVTVAKIVTAPPSPASGPPAGIGDFGRLVWNLDALLRDTFGDSRFYLETGPSGAQQADFNTSFAGQCCSLIYNFTFANATSSQFTLRRPPSKLQAEIGADGGSDPVSVRHEFVSCARDKWLYMRFGNGIANWQISCQEGFFG